MPVLADIYWAERMVEIVASSESLEAMAAFIEGASDGDRLDVQPTKTSASPYVGFCRQISVRHCGVRVLIDRCENELIICGSRENLRPLASTIRGVAATDDEGHVHFEYFEGDWQLDPESIPLVIGRD